VAVNQATAPELERLPSIGPALAQRIIAFRERHGPFRTLDDLLGVPGIGKATVGKLAPLVKF
jgi:competence protein ComEA